MAEGYGGGRPAAVYLPLWQYLGGQTIAGDGTNQAATLPAVAQIFQIDAEGGDVYYAINGGVMVGYCPENAARIQGPLVNLNTLLVNAAAGVTVHLQYYREHTKRR